MAKHKKELDDACKHYQNTLKEEQSKLELVNSQRTQETQNSLFQRHELASAKEVIISSMRREEQTALKSSQSQVEMSAAVELLRQDNTRKDVLVESLKVGLQNAEESNKDFKKLLSETQKDLMEERQRRVSHSSELAKHKTKLDDACKHYQNSLKVEQSKLELVTQELEISKSDIVQLKADANNTADALEAQKDESMEVQGVIASLQRDLAAADLDKQNLQSLSSTLRTQVTFFSDKLTANFSR